MKRIWTFTKILSGYTLIIISLFCLLNLSSIIRPFNEENHLFLESVLFYFLMLGFSIVDQALEKNRFNRQTGIVLHAQPDSPAFPVRIWRIIKILCGALITLTSLVCMADTAAFSPGMFDKETVYVLETMFFYFSVHGILIITGTINKKRPRLLPL